MTQLELPRPTSRAAYRELRGTGRLGDLQLKAYQALFHSGPMTGQELARETGIPGIWKRLSELRNKAYIVEAGKRRCTVTGKQAIVWSLARS